MNSATGNWTSISGGESNSLAGDSGTIAGGYFNVISSGATSVTIGGGNSNKIVIGAVGATIPGGHVNTATTNAFAAGFNANAIAGSFVWSDGNGISTVPRTPIQLRFVRAAVIDYSPARARPPVFSWHLAVVAGPRFPIET